MKCFIIYTIIIVSGIVKASDSALDTQLFPNEVDIVPVNREKKQEKRGIGYNALSGYTSGLGIDGNSGYNGGAGYYGGYNGGIGGYNGGHLSSYAPPRVAGLGGISGYNNPGYYNNGYNTAYNGYNGYAGYSGGYPSSYPSGYNGGYTGGYTAGYSNSRLGYPNSRQGYYNSYPSSYYNNNLGSSILGGGLGFGGVPTAVPVIASGGYQYGPGISGGIY